MGDGMMWSWERARCEIGSLHTCVKLSKNNFDRKALVRARQWLHMPLIWSTE